ncbi:hypothetical protein HZH66_010794 [Vespula vulgaris]|uniref:Secreted protein n=1 Tax=Vespula vulgaris TaxID=7454 RepID=A0A834JHL4_VESVU|nr:hypothetical protein HZH66_010794 [Vespula vulgaris]
MHRPATAFAAPAVTAAAAAVADVVVVFDDVRKTTATRRLITKHKYTQEGLKGPAGPEGRLPFSPPPPATTTTTTVLLPPPPPPSSPPPSTPPPAAHLSRGGTKDSIEFERKFPCNVERGRDHLRTDHKRGTTFLD